MRRLAQQTWRALGSDGANRTVRLLLLLIIFALPFGTVVLLSQAHAVVAGSYNPFAVPTLYLVEPVIVVTAVLWARIHPDVGRQLGPYKPLLGVVALAAVSVWWAPEPTVAVVAVGHLFTAFLLLYMLAHEFRDQRFLYQAIWTLVGSVSGQAVWAIAQFYAGHDFGMHRVGESVLGPKLSNVAKVTVDGQSHIRAYGTLPHPNLLAAYVAAAIFAVGTFIFWPVGAGVRAAARARRRPWAGAALGLLLGLLGTALILTFSRTAIVLVLAGGVLVVLFSFRKWHRLPAAAAVAAAISLLAAALVWHPLTGRTTIESPQETGVTNRLVGYQIAVDAIQNRPLGVGAGNFVPAIDSLRGGLPDYQHQPAHNALLLATAETGILGGLLLLWFLVRTGWRFHRVNTRDRRANTLNFSLLMLAGVFVGISLVDHFFWSLPQGLWLAVLVLAAMISRIPRADFERRGHHR